MSIMLTYFLFALTTSLTSYYELFGPVLEQLAVTEPYNNLIRYRVITFLVVLGSGLILAPLLLLPCLVPSMGTRFRSALFESLLEGKKF